MQYTRWYDKDQTLSVVMSALEKLDDKLRHAVATDLLQLILQKEDNQDNLIKKLGHQYTGARRRWYDKEDTIYSAVELLKIIDKPDRDSILKEILYTIMHFVKEKNELEIIEKKFEDEYISWD